MRVHDFQASIGAAYARVAFQRDFCINAALTPRINRDLGVIGHVITRSGDGVVD